MNARITDPDTSHRAGRSMSDVGEIVSLTKLARHLGISRHHLGQLADEGHIPIHHTSDAGRRTFSTVQVAAHLERSGELTAERQAS